MLVVNIIIMISGYIIFKRNGRNALGGIICVLGAIFTAFSLFFFTLEKISQIGMIGELLSLVLVYICIPIIFFYMCFYFIRNTKVMDTKEGKSFTAKLAMVLGVNMLIIFPLFFLLISGVLNSQKNIMIFLTIFLLLDIVFVLLFFFYLAYSWMYQMFPVKSKIDYIIVLGAGIRSEEVTPLLKSRLDKGIEYWKINNGSKFIVSGGQGVDEPVSEAYAMAKYLKSQNVPEEDIILEDMSTTTYENMKFSKEKINEDWQGEKKPAVIFSTNNYHVLRASLYAKKVRLNALGVGSPTALYFLPTALIREYIAMLVKHKVFTLFVIISVSLFVYMSYMPI